MSVQTVLGKVSKKELGIITPHEHVFINLSAFFEKREIEGFDNSDSAKVTIDRLGVLNRDPYALKDNLIMDDFEMQKKELLRFKHAGGKTVVDATTIGINRDPRLLYKMAQETGLNIIAGAGYYVCSTHPERLSELTVQEVAEQIVRELQVGMDDTDIKAGIIGEIGISEVFDTNERKVLRASAIAHAKTGAAVLVHINPWTTNGIEAAEILLSEGVPPDKICISHVDVEAREEYIKKLLEMGVCIEFDNFGKEYYVNKEARRSGYGLFINDRERVRVLVALIDKGYLNQILLSCDVCLKTLLCSYGGWGYDHVLTNIVPMMQEAGIKDFQIKQMLQGNPADFLCKGE
jgi:phosphotriesterase-related protein